MKKHVILFFFIVGAASAEMTTLRGSNGRMLDFDVRDVIRDGIIAVPPGKTDAILMQWSWLDLPWLKANRPALEKKRVAATTSANPFESTETARSLASVRSLMLTTLTQEKSLGSPPQGKLKPDTYAHYRNAVLNEDGKTSLLKLIMIASNRNTPFSRDVLLWFRESGQPHRELEVALKFAISQGENLPVNSDTLIFLNAARGLAQVLASMRANPATESANWPDDFAALVRVIR